MNNTTKITDLQRFLSDGKWHLGSEISQAVSHRFSAAAHSAKQRGLYQLDKRWNSEHQQYEYKLAKASKVSPVMEKQLIDRAVDLAFDWIDALQDGCHAQKDGYLAYWTNTEFAPEVHLLNRNEAIAFTAEYIRHYIFAENNISKPSLRELTNLYKEMCDFVESKSKNKKVPKGRNYGELETVDWMPLFAPHELDAIWRFYKITQALRGVSA